MRFLSHRSVLYRYLATYIGVAVAACSVVGIILFTSATNQLLNETRRTEQFRLDMCRDNLVNTINMMDEIAIQISTGKEYQPFFLSKGALNHVAMLEKFQRYQNYSPLIQQYYLYYPETETVFTPKAEYRFYLFVQNVLGLETDNVRQNILANNRVLSVYRQNDRFFLSYPIVFIRANNHSYAYLLFEIDIKTLSEYFSKMFMLNRSFQISYFDQTLNDVQLEKNYLESKAELPWGEFVLRTSPSYYGINSFQIKALLVIAFVTVAISAVSAVVAWRAYLPIRKLASKLKLSDETEKNEMKLIESMMENMKEEKQITMKRLTGSLERITALTSFLRKQIVMKLLFGQQGNDWKRHINNCGMNLDRPFLCVLLVQSKKNEKFEQLLESLESNSTPDIAVYGVILSKQDGIAAILSANEDDELTAFCKALQSVLFQEGFEVTVRQGKIVNHLDKLPDSFFSAQSSQKKENSVDVEAIYNVKDLDDIRQALSECDREKALFALDSILVDIMSNATSMLMQRYYIIQLTYQMVSAGRKNNIFLPNTIIHQVIMAENSRLLSDRLRMLLNRIFDERIPIAPSNTILSGKNEKLMNYITEHAFDYAMCLDLVATEFDISTKQVSRIVKSVCGETFKDYLFRLRMNKAIELLKQGISTEEVTKRIGYTDERYFKKRFFEYTGDSVMKYQSNSRNHTN